ncbi:putative coniferyl aldehyde dehydrogenase [Pseudomonas sp. 9AZ]|uniref:coniferyl aldehyde dehydrogenase n=1 Tax=Pseudomonas sp. 9AZ TaxID=2653168 RepID=UPI0012F3403D|nr:coniferyl aldehyde dehydrogenase [Pseudomonas sp. 9AZ]VXD04176.1 putative coniferyl aldehyde dehydrogenase [Pseudomonas sp. 9AZ]
MNKIIDTDPANVLTQLQQRFSVIKQAATAEGFTPVVVRIDRLRRLETIIVDNQRVLAEAAMADFAGRPIIQTRMEMVGALSSIRDAIKHVRRWARSEKRPVPFPMGLLGTRAHVFYQPLGVVGVISPWNFPIVLSLGALASVFAAGNRAMLKPSELAPESSRVMKELIERHFDPSELTVVLGEAAVGQAFSRMPFDHLLFTGAPVVAKHVMAAAAENLVPVTLELGGKCPVIIGRSADIDLAVDRVMWGKIQNAGQICLAPDYVFVPREMAESFIERAHAKIRGWYTHIKDNDQFCSIISERHFARLNGYVEQARERGVRIETIDPAKGNFTGQNSRRIAPTILVEPHDDLDIMQDEIFGPLLSLKTYESLPDVIDYINARPRPLALYYFGSDKAEMRDLKERTVSGGMSVNDIALHAANENLPLGGVGNSGMGAYHGRDGFRQFSHAKAVMTQGRISLAKMFFNPPYSDKQQKLLDRLIKKAY